MSRRTRLGDDALIYQPRKKQSEKEKLSEMNFKGKLEYLWEYYKLHALGIIAVIALIVYFINSILNPKPSTQLYIAMIDNPIEDSVLDKYNTAMVQRLQLNKKRECIEFNTAFMYNADDSYTLNMKQALGTYIFAGEVDAVIAPESEFKTCISNGYVGKLSDKLPTDIYSSLTDQFYISSTKEDKEKSAYGIYLTDTKLYKNITMKNEPYLLGILVNAPHEDNTIEFIRYLFNEK